MQLSIFQELLSQTKLLCQVVKSAKMECCSKLEIIFPLSHEELEIIVKFLYDGQILCDENYSMSDIQQTLTKLLGFPENMKLDKEILPETKFEVKKNEFLYHFDPLDVQVKTEVMEDTGDYEMYDNNEMLEKTELTHDDIEEGKQKHVVHKAKTVKQEVGLSNTNEENFFGEKSVETIVKSVKYHQSGNCTFCGKVSKNF